MGAGTATVASSMPAFQDGDEVLLHDLKGRRYRLRLRAGQNHSLHSGSIPHDALIGADEGTVVTTNRGGRLLALRLTYGGEVTERRRRAQPIYPKDLLATVFHALGIDQHKQYVDQTGRPQYLLPEGAKPIAELV